MSEAKRFYWSHSTLSTFDLIEELHTCQQLSGTDTQHDGSIFFWFNDKSTLVIEEYGVFVDDVRVSDS
ncbi:hypothetical protein [Marinicella sp. W31]|uniref:hypothetical protein n=1 Tax=Marinicella sp. W31 TaxID=3023713 RepID=UPI0037567E3F